MSPKKAKKLLNAVDHLDSVRYRLKAVLMMAEAMDGGDGEAVATVTQDALRKLDAAQAKINAVRCGPSAGGTA